VLNLIPNNPSDEKDVMVEATAVPLAP